MIRRYNATYAARRAIGQLARSWRHQAGMTRRVLAHRIGVPERVVGCMEHGRSMPTIRVLMRTAQATGGDVRQALAVLDIFARDMG